MQVPATEIEPGDVVIVMTKSLARVISVERPLDGPNIGDRIVNIRAIEPWSAYDCVRLTGGQMVERIDSANTTPAIDAHKGGGGYV